MKAGAAQVVITPPIGTELSGFGFGPRPCEGVHDDVKAKAIVLEEGNTKAAIICCDLLGIDGDFARLVKQAIGGKTGIPPENIMICASHTHSGPAVHFLRGCGAVDMQYLRNLGDKLVSVVVEAASTLRPVRVGSGCTEYNLGFNRREVRERKNSMDQEEGTVDREVGIVRIDEDIGRPLAVVYNYAAHPVTQMGNQNRQVTADYPGAASRLIESQLGVIAAFMQGCCGNINPKVWGDFSVTEKAGAALGEKVVAAWKSITCEECSPLMMRSTVLALPLDGPPTIAQAEAEVEKAKEEYETKGKPLHLYYRLDWAQDVLRHVRQGTAPQTVSAPIQVLRMGETAIVALPGEEFVETGRRIKDASPARRTLVAAYSNSANMGYVPIREEYPKMGYEVYGAHMWYGLFRLAPGGAESIAATAIELLNEAYRI